MTLVAGIDSSTQSCKVLIVDADTGHTVRSATTAHPTGTAVAPTEWWAALQRALADAGGLAGVAAVSVAAQQHGMVCLDEGGAVVRDALLWNDLRSAQAVGSVPVASFTVIKLRWLAEHEPANLDRTSAVCLPHDWLTWQLRGSSDITELITDRSDASGTGYWSPAAQHYRIDLLDLACGRVPHLPAVLSPAALAGSVTGHGAVLGCGAADNAAAALGSDLTPGDVLLSLGTSGVAATLHTTPAADATGAVAGFADATGRFLPLVSTLNATRVFDAIGSLLGPTPPAPSTVSPSPTPRPRILPARPSRVSSAGWPRALTRSAAKVRPSTARSSSAEAPDLWLSAESQQPSSAYPSSFRPRRSPSPREQPDRRPGPSRPSPTPLLGRSRCGPRPRPGRTPSSGNSMPLPAT